MGNYGRTSGTGSRGTGAITNDDEWTLDLPEQDDIEEYTLSKQMDKRAY